VNAGFWVAAGWPLKGFVTFAGFGGGEAAVTAAGAAFRDAGGGLKPQRRAPDGKAAGSATFD